MHTQRTDIWTRQGKGGGMNWEMRIHMYTLPCKLASEKLYVARGAQLSACDG